MARRGLRALGAALMLVVATGCGGGTSSQATQSFVARVHQLAPDVNGYADDASLVDLGHAVCYDLSSGASAQQVADRVGYEGAGARLPSADLGSVMAAATQTLCPRFAGMFGGGVGELGGGGGG
jgi:hypothetical protein